VRRLISQVGLFAKMRRCISETQIASSSGDGDRCMVRDSAEYEVDPDVEASEFDAGYCEVHWRRLPSCSRMANNMSIYG
jgi:hypothetical protein